MIEINNQEVHCPICRQLLETENCVIFIDCNHKFCFSCVHEIIFRKVVQCPLDRKFVTLIEEKNLPKSLQQYRAQIFLRYKFLC